MSQTAVLPALMRLKARIVQEVIVPKKTVVVDFEMHSVAAAAKHFTTAIACRMVDG